MNGYQSKIDSPITLAVPNTAIDMPRELQSYFQPVYSSLYTLVDAMNRYCGVASLGESEGMALPPASQLRPQNLNRYWLAAGEDLLPGHVIALVPDGSGQVSLAYKADYTDATKCAAGVYNGDLTITAGDWCEVWLFAGLVTKIAGLVPGTRYFLGASGLITPGPATADGYISQFIGTAITTSALAMNIGTPRKNQTGSTSTTFLRAI